MAKQAVAVDSEVLAADPDGVIDWFGGNGAVLPLRRLPSADSGRVKAYRKQVRDGSLAPVLLWWVSALACHVVIDGHDRLAAAMAEGVSAPLFGVDRDPRSD